MEFRNLTILEANRQSSSTWTEGDSVVLSTVVTMEDIRNFCALAGDANRMHLDEAYAATTAFKGVVAPGMLSADFISGLLGTHIPGPGTIWSRQELDFVQVVRPGDTVLVCGKILAIEDGKKPGIKKIKLETTCSKPDGTVVINGVAFVSYKAPAA